jgi:hypothetical protein
MFRIFYSDGTHDSSPNATAEEAQQLIEWFKVAPPNAVVSINFEVDKTRVHAQKRNITRIVETWR